MTSRLFCLTAVLLMATAHAAPPDVAGIHAGMSLQQARALAEKANASYQFGEMKSDGKTVGFSARASAEGVDQMVVLATDDGKVWLAGREQHYPDGKRIGHDVLEKALIDKYGAYSDRHIVRPHGWTWDYTPAGQQYVEKKGAGPNPCPPANTSGGGINWRWLPGSNMLGMPHRFPESCGQRVVAKVEAGTDKMVTRFAVQVLDSAAMLAQIKRENSQKATQHQQRLDQEKAANKPKL